MIFLSHYLPGPSKILIHYFHLFLIHRSPEEYNYDMENEKIDVYSGGNIIFKILTGLAPFVNTSERKAKRAVRDGRRPEIASRYRASGSVVNKALIKAIDMAWTHDPKERPAAADIAELLRGTLDTLEKRL